MFGSHLLKAKEYFLGKDKRREKDKIRLLRCHFKGWFTFSGGQNQSFYFYSVDFLGKSKGLIGI
jgi:hypothetical protein